MADFRKWFLAFAVLGLLSGLAIPASAQVATTTPFTCTAGNGGVPPIVRAEGLTELVGDVVLNCTGGTPTPVGQVVPQANITIFLSTNITSRLTTSGLGGGDFSEALLIVDEPHSPVNPNVPLVPCGAATTVQFTTGICLVSGSAAIPAATAPGTALGSVSGNVAGGVPGFGTFNPTVAQTVGGTGIGTRPNVFQGRQTGVNQVTFFGVPVDPPGTAGTRVFRITNVRSNANQLGVSSTLVPTQVTMYISISGSTAIPINNPQVTVAFVQPGLVTSVRGTNTFLQCISENASLAASSSASSFGPFATTGPSGTVFGQQFAIRYTEGFATAFKEKNIQTRVSNLTSPIAYPADAAQDIPGAIYNTESGFEVNGVDINPFPAPAQLAIPAIHANPAFPTTNGLNLAGVATQGTRLTLGFGTIPNGVSIFLPIRVNLVSATTGAVTGFAVLLSGTDQNGAGGFAAASATTGAGSNTTGFGNPGVAPVSIFGGAASAVYEVLLSDPTQVERFDVPVAVAYIANPGNNLPQPTVQSTAGAGFAPVSNVGTASASAPIPRFAPTSTPRNTFNIVKCNCNLLFPFVTNQQGFDTGVAISNTSLDIYGTTPQTGTVTLNYFSAGTPPPAQTTNANVPAGQTLTFTLSGGGNFGIAATPGFQGYLIAQAQFQYCHAFAYISAQGALPTAPGASEGYLGIVLDAPGIYRTGQIGENLAH